MMESRKLLLASEEQSSNAKWGLLKKTAPLLFIVRGCMDGRKVGYTLLTNLLNNTLASKSSVISVFVAERDELILLRKLQTITGWGGSVIFDC